MHSTRNRCGFTVVETMVAMLAFSVLVLTMGTVLINTWRAWRGYMEVVGLQRDAMVAMQAMASEIRDSSIDEISGDAEGLYFSIGATRTNAFVFNKTEIPFTAGVSLTGWTPPIISNNNVTIAFTLRTSTSAYEKDYVITVYPRNAP